MTRYAATLRRLAAWSGLSDQRSRELVTDACASAGASPRRRAGELGGVVGLALAMRARRATGGDGLRIVRQGARLGGGIALAFALVVLTRHSLDHGTPWLVALLVPAAAGLALPRGEERVRAAAACAAGAIALMGAVLTGAPPLLGALFIVGHVGLAAGEPSTDRSRGRGDAPPWGIRWAAAAVALAALAAVLDAGQVAVVTSVGVAVVPGVMLPLGRHDPRLAVAATILLTSRFGMLDRRALDALLGAGGTDDLAVSLARIALMLSVVGVGAALSRASVRRAAHL